MQKKYQKVCLGQIRKAHDATGAYLLALTPMQLQTVYILVPGVSYDIIRSRREETPSVTQGLDTTWWMIKGADIG